MNNPGEQAACYRSTTHATRHKLRAHTHSPRTGRIPLSQSPSRCLIHTTTIIGRLRETTGWSCRLETFCSNWPVRDSRGNLVCLLHRSESPHCQVHFSSRIFSLNVISPCKHYNYMWWPLEIKRSAETLHLFFFATTRRRASEMNGLDLSRDHQILAILFKEPPILQMSTGVTPGRE